MTDIFEGSKVIAAVRSPETFQACLKSNCKVVFLLFGNLLTVPDYIQQLKEHGKSVFVHLDLIEGLSSSRSSVDYINEKTNADGIISIKQSLLKYAKSLGFLTVLRIFMLDSKSIDSLEKINVENEKNRNTNFVLAKAVRIVLNEGLRLLGIQYLEEM